VEQQADQSPQQLNPLTTSTARAGVAPADFAAEAGDWEIIEEDRMDLQQFIRESLVQIAAGIEDASKELVNSSAVVNPRHVNVSHNEAVKAYGWESDVADKLRTVQLIQFDVAVTATEGKENKGGIGISIGNVGLGAARKEDVGSSALSRIQFSVPMVLPTAAK
jgi:hypothetical protein